MKEVSVLGRAVKKVRNFYPWVFADEVLAPAPGAEPGEVVRVLDPAGNVLGTAFHHPSARVSLRVLDLGPEPPDEGSWRGRIRSSMGLRAPLRGVTDAWRAVYAESDGLPGLVADWLAGHMVVQFRCAGMDRLRPLMLDLLREEFQPLSVYERSDVPQREEEGLAPVVGQVAGVTPGRVEVSENGVRYGVDVVKGQKTGFFTDQRDARKKFAGRCRPGMEVLDAFSYTGGFGIPAAVAGARVTAVDKDAPALALMRANAELNGVAERVKTVEADLFFWLAYAAGENRRYDAISLDPPALVKFKNQQGRGRGLIMDLVRPCLRMLNDGGVLHLSTCAYHLLPDITREAVRIAASDVGVRLLVLEETSQGIDHPVLLQMPESLYLKGLTLQVHSRRPGG